MFNEVLGKEWKQDPRIRVGEHGKLCYVLREPRKSLKMRPEFYPPAWSTEPVAALLTISSEKHKTVDAALEEIAAFFKTLGPVEVIAMTEPRIYDDSFCQAWVDVVVLQRENR